MRPRACRTGPCSSRRLWPALRNRNTNTTATTATAADNANNSRSSSSSSRRRKKSAGTMSNVPPRLCAERELVALVLALLLSADLPATATTTATPPTAVTVTASAVTAVAQPLQSSDGAAWPTDALVLRAALQLQSEDPMFGGLSSLLLDQQGNLLCPCEVDADV